MLYNNKVDINSIDKSKLEAHIKFGENLLEIRKETLRSYENSRLIIEMRFYFLFITIPIFLTLIVIKLITFYKPN